MKSPVQNLRGGGAFESGMRAIRVLAEPVRVSFHLSLVRVSTTRFEEINYIRDTRKHGRAAAGIVFVLRSRRFGE